MLGTNNRTIKILGAAWLVLGGLSFAILFLALIQFALSSGEPEDGIMQNMVFVLVLLVLGATQTTNGLTLLRRNPLARPFIAISSLVLLIPSAVSALSGIGIILLLIVVYSLWLTLSRGGREVFESYIARENG